MVDKPKFGEKITVHKLAVKDHWSGKTFWKKEERYDLPRVGLFIGKRYVYDGELLDAPLPFGYSDEDPYEEPYFSRTKMHEIWLIVFNEKENPVRAFPEDVSKE